MIALAAHDRPNFKIGAEFNGSSYGVKKFLVELRKYSVAECENNWREKDGYQGETTFRPPRPVKSDFKQITRGGTCLGCQNPQRVRRFVQKRVRSECCLRKIVGQWGVRRASTKGLPGFLGAVGDSRIWTIPGAETTDRTRTAAKGVTSTISNHAGPGNLSKRNRPA
jgi:hypothetical protein